MTKLIRIFATLALFISLLPIAAQDLAAPDWELQDSSGNTVRSSDFAGKPLVINFWENWCSYCKSYNQA
ncbi:MAG: peroxiredoxin family protein [Alteromonas sp.]